MRCDYCGCENIKGSMYCKNCGKYLQSRSVAPVPVQERKGSGTKALIIGLISFMSIFLIAIIVGVVFIFGGSGEFAELKSAANDLEKMIEDTDCGVMADKYTVLVEEARDIIENKDKDLAEDKQAELEAAMDNLENLDTLVSEMSTLQSTYVSRFAMYSVEEPYLSRVQDLNARNEQAVADKDITQKDALQEEYEGLDGEILENNKSQVETLRYDIARIDTSQATETEKLQLTAYNDSVSAALSEGNYLRAISELKSYQTYAQAISDAAASRAQAAAATPTPAPTPTPTPSASTSEYILPNSSTAYLTAADVAGLTKRELELARNEIFARHGRKFRDATIQAYFDSKFWYRGVYEPDEVDFNDLTSIEQTNVNFIKRYE